MPGLPIEGRVTELPPVTGPSTFLFTTAPANDLGPVTRVLPVAAELAGRGHEVVFCTPASAPRRLVADAGFENALPRRAPLLPVRSAPAPSHVWNLDHLSALMGMTDEKAVRAWCVSLRDLISELEPDVVVDSSNAIAVIAARALGKPVVTVIQADMHPASQGFVWWTEHPADVPTPVPTVNRVLRELGLAPIDSISEFSVGDLTLVAGMPETDPLPAGVDVIYVGALLWYDENAVLPDWAEDLGRERPLLWTYSANPRYTVGGGSFDSDVLLRSCIEALRETDVDVVLTTGHHALPNDVLPLPPNFHHASYVRAGLELAKRSHLLMHHGGHPSCLMGLISGTPAVIIPTYSERESNGRRLEAMGAGAIVPVGQADGTKSVRAEDVRERVQRVLDDPSFTDRAQAAGEKLRALGGPVRAADLIEQQATELIAAPSD
jgi:UDP:flavonoid glycosyltransferase YjiC (YdhE family)